MSTSENRSQSLLVFKTINKPYAIMGLSPLMFVVFVLSILISALINKYLAISMAVIVSFVMKKVQLENKKGYPDYLKGLIKFSSLGRYYVDTDSHLSYIIRGNEKDRVAEDNSL